MTADRLSPQALSHATLAQQFLLKRTVCSLPEVVEHLVGLQAQAPLAPHYGLLSRVEGFRAGDLTRLLVNRAVVQMAVLRGTIHLVTRGTRWHCGPW